MRTENLNNQGCSFILLIHHQNLLFWQNQTLITYRAEWGENIGFKCSSVNSLCVCLCQTKLCWSHLIKHSLWWESVCCVSHLQLSKTRFCCECNIHDSLIKNDFPWHVGNCCIFFPSPLCFRRVTHAHRVPDNFHARYCARSRTYVYRIAPGISHPTMLPLTEHNLCWGFCNTWVLFHHRCEKKSVPVPGLETVMCWTHE